MIARAKADSTTLEAVTWLEEPRVRANAERRNFEVTFDTATNHIKVERLNPDASKTLILDHELPDGTKFVKFAGTPDTPDLFGNASAVDFDGPAPHMFASDGSFTDANGDPSNGTIFIGKTGRTETGRAVTIFGATGLLRPLETGRESMELMSANGGAPVRMRQSADGVLVDRGHGRDPRAHCWRVVARRGGGARLQTVGSSSAMLIAREKAREAVESVHSARDTGELSWSRVRNVADGGAFLNGAQDVQNARPGRLGEHRG